MSVFAVVLGLVTAAPAWSAPFAYISNRAALGDVSVIDVATNGVVATVSTPGSPQGVAVHPDGTQVYVTNNPGTNIFVISTATNTVTSSITVAANPIGIAVNAAGTRAYVTHAGGTTVSVIDTTSNTVLTTVTVATGPSGVAVTPDGTKVYVAHFSGNTVSVLNAGSNTVSTTVTVGAAPQGIAINPAGTFVYVANSTPDSVSVINTATDSVVGTVTGIATPYGVVVSPDGTRAYVSASGGNSVAVVNTATNTVIASVPVGTAPRGISITPDGSRVYVANTTSNDVSVIDTGSNTVVATVPVGSGPYAFGLFIGGPSPPGAPTIGTATPGNGSATINFTPPAFNGGSAITGYTATCAPGPVSAGGAASPITVTGLANGTPYTCSVTATNAVGTGPPSASVAVTPGVPAISVTGTTTFPSIAVGNGSAVQAITITNTGTGTLTLGSITHSNPGVFPDTSGGPAPQATHYCGFGSNAGGAPQTGGPINIPPAGTCVLNLIFAPNVTGALSGNITVNSNAPTSPTTISLTGTGLPPNASISPASIAFGNAPVSLGVNQISTFNNPSAAPYTITALSITGLGFSVTPSGASPCNIGAVVNGGAGCTYTVTFTATGPGSSNGTTTVGFQPFGTGPSYSATQNANGNGYLLPFTQSPASISFGNVPRTLPVSQTYTFTNTSDSTPFPTSYTINSFNVSGLGFTAVGSGGTPCNIGTVLAPAASCTVSATITATGPGSTNGTVSIGFLGGLGADPQYTASESLNAIGYDLPFTLSPASISFGNVPVGSPVNQNFTFTNTSNSTPFPTSYTINSFTVGGLGFTAVGSGGTPCNNGAVLAPGASCSVTATITASGTGSTNGTVNIGFLGGLGADPQYTATESLNAIGVTVAPTITSGAPPTGTVGTPYTFTFTANGTPTIGWTVIAGALPAGLTLSAGGVLSGTPTAAGSSTFTVQASNGTLPDSTQGVTLAIAAAPAPVVSLTGSGAFPVTVEGAASAVQAITIQNTGTANLVISAVQVSPAGLFVDTTGGPAPNAAHYCNFGSDGAGGALAGTPQTLTPGQSCTINMVFKPTSIGSFSHSLSFTSNAAGSPHSVPLSGSSAAPAITLSPNLSFGNQAEGTTSAPQSVTLTNSSPVSITLTGPLTVSPVGQFTVTPAGATPCTNGLVVPAMGSCTVNVTFTPTSISSFNYTLAAPYQVVTSNLSANSSLSGSGIAPAVSLAPNLAFGNVVVGASSAPQTVTFTNSSAAGVTLTSALVVSPPGLFAVTPSGATPCTSGLLVAALGSCTVSVVFTPTAAGSFNYSLSASYQVVTSNLTASSSLGGAGVAATGPFAYIANASASTVSVIDLPTASVVATIPVGLQPYGVAVNSAATRVYVTSRTNNTISVIDTATNTVTATIPVGTDPFGVAVNTAGTRVYVTNRAADNVSVIDTASNMVIATIPVGTSPHGVAVNSTATRVYVVNQASSDVSVIDTATNTVVATIPGVVVGTGIALNPSGSRAYVASTGSGNMTVIDTQSNTVVTTVFSGNTPIGIAVNPQGTRVYVANYNANEVNIFDTATNASVGPLSVNGPVGCPYGVSFNPAGTRAYVAGGCSNTVGEIDTASVTIVGVIGAGAGPTAIGQFIVPAAVSLVAPAITSTAPAAGTVGVAYTHQYTANGSSPASWAVISGSLPAGLTLNPLTGLLSGTPTAAGTFNFTVQAANGTMPDATQVQTIAVTSTCGNTEVTNTNDSGACSLRAAIAFANGNCIGAQTVTFNIPGPGPHLIQPLGPLPPVSCNNTAIDGYSQPGSAANTAAAGQTNADIRIRLDGALQSGGSGLEFPLGVNGVIQGLSITNFATGILAYTGVNIRGNFIGVLTDGVTPAKNGVGVSAGANAFGGHCCIQVGSIAAADVNLIASTGDAVQYLGNVSGQVVNNLFGVDRNGNRVPALGSSQGVGSYLSSPFNANNLQVRNNLFAHQNVVVASQGANVLFTRNSAVLSNVQRSSSSVLYSEIEITRVLYDAAGSTTIEGNINAKGASTHRIEVFSNPTPFGLTQTESYVADIDVTPAGVGLFPFAQTFPSILSIPSVTVTFLANNETFVPLQYRKPVTVVAAPTPFTVVAGAPAATQTLTLTNISGSAFTFSATPAVASGTGFAVNGGTCAGSTVSAAATCTVILEFASPIATTAAGSVDITLTGVGQGTTNYTLPVDTVYRFALTGTATAPVGPVFTPSTASLTFAAQSVATTSAPQTLTITNTGTAVMSILGPSITGPFAISANSCTGLAPAGTCTMSITFTPTVAGAATGTLSIPTNAPGSPHTIGLSGTGVTTSTPTMTVAFAPASVLTATNATMTLTLSNPNASPAIISIGGAVSVPGLSMSGLVDGCSASASIGTGNIDLGMAGSIPALGSCTISVQVQSATAGSFPVTVSPGNLVTSFGNNTNTSTATLTVNAVATGPFAYIPIFTSFSGSTVSVIDLPTNTLATTISVGVGPVGAAVNYAGTRAYISNQQSNSISVIDTATNTVVATVPVGSQPGAAAVNPAGTRVYVPNQSSASLSVIDATTNSVIATITGLSTPVSTAVHPSGAKAYVALNASNTLGVIDATTNTLSASIPVCSAPYQPVVNSSGTKVYVVCTSGSVSVVDTGTASVIATITVGTNARGIALTPNGAQAWVTNTGSNNVSVIDTATNTVTATLMAGSSPWGVAGNAAGTRMYVANNASNSVTVFDTGSNAIVATVPVGVGPLAVGQFVQPAAVVAAPAVALSPSALTFGVRTVNTTSPVQVVTLSNSGSASLVISSITSSGDFAFTTTCPISTPPIAPAGTCSVNISFTPLTAAALSGSVTITSNAPGSPHVISLSGTGAAVGVTNIAVNPTSVDFGTVTIATGSQPFTVTVSNTGFANLLLSAITTSGPFARTNRPSVPPDCGASVAPGAACSISLVFTPAVVGAASGQLSITHNASGSPSLVALTGLATAVPVPVLSVAPRVAFGDQIINTATSLALNLSNTGTATLNIGSVALSGSSDFSQSGTCRVVAAGGSCVIDLGFRPSSIGTRTAQLDITSNTGSQSPSTTVGTSIAISGNGILAPRPAAEVSLTAIGFGNAIFGGATTSQLVTLKSVGSSPLDVRNIFTSGADFVQMNSCAGSLSTNASCLISIAFSPLSMGAKSGELQMITNAIDSPHKVQLTGTGCRWFSQTASRFFITSCGN